MPVNFNGIIIKERQRERDREETADMPVSEYFESRYATRERHKIPFTPTMSLYVLVSTLQYVLYMCTCAQRSTDIYFKYVYMEIPHRRYGERQNVFYSPLVR